MSKLEMVKKLKSGEVISNYKEGGNSMTPLIHSKEPVTIYPVDTDKLENGDIVFCKVHGNFYMHLITALKKDEVQISNNHGYVNGWTKIDNVFGIITEVNGRQISKSFSKIKIFKSEVI